MENNFKKELIENLEETINWSFEFQNGNRDFSFDIDNKLFSLSEKYNIDFKNGTLFLIYSLLDFYTDAIKHSFKRIDNDYTVLNAETDIDIIIKHLSSSDNINLPEEMKIKLEYFFKNKNRLSWVKRLKKKI